jgi:excisionase family DNA binding protein
MTPSTRSLLMSSLPATLTYEEAAEELRLTLGGLRNLVETGQLPAVRFGRKSVRILRSDLEAFLQASRVEVQS